MSLRHNIIAFILAFGCLLASPLTAYAEYANTSISTVAQVRTDGSLHVTEQRTFDFHEEHSILTWAITGWNGEQKVDLESVRIMQTDGEGNVVRNWAALPEVAFQSIWREFAETTDGLTEQVDAAVEKARRADDTAGNVALPESEAWAFDERRDVIYLFLKSGTDEAGAITAIECNYIVKNAALVWDDVGELYWDYVAANDDVVVSNVNAQVQLPVPEGTGVVPGDNLLAWGHGAPGTVEVDTDGTVDYAVPEVPAGQYAQAHIVFPKTWMANLTIQAKLAKSGVRYDDAVLEEDEWTDSYSAWRVNSLVLDVAMLAFCALVVAGAMAVYGLLGRERRPREDGACDDALLENAPVMGRLARWNHESVDDFVATVAQLERKGVIRVNEGEADPGSDVRFRVTASAKDMPLSPLEQDAMRFLFDQIGDEYQSISLAEIREFCKRHPADVRETLSKWQALLTKEVDREGLFDARSRKAAFWMLIVSGVLMLCALYQWVIAHSLAGVLLFGATAVTLTVIAHYVPRLTQRGADLSECLRAGALERDMPEADRSEADALDADEETDSEAGDAEPADTADNESADAAADIADAVWMTRLSAILESTIEGK